MDSLVRLNLNPDTDITLLGDKLIQCSGCILEYNSLDNFRNTFGRFSSILYEHVDKIKAVMSVNNGEIFQSNVHIISKLEDKFNIPIDNFDPEPISYFQ